MFTSSLSSIPFLLLPCMTRKCLKTIFEYWLLHHFLHRQLSLVFRINSSRVLAVQSFQFHIRISAVNIYPSSSSCWIILVFTQHFIPELPYFSFSWQPLPNLSSAQSISGTILTLSIDFNPYSFIKTTIKCSYADATRNHKLSSLCQSSKW